MPSFSSRRNWLPRSVRKRPRWLPRRELDPFTESRWCVTFCTVSCSSFCETLQCFDSFLPTSRTPTVAQHSSVFDALGVCEDGFSRLLCSSRLRRNYTRNYAVILYPFERGICNAGSRVTAQRKKGKKKKCPSCFLQKPLRNAQKCLDKKANKIL